MNTAQRRKAIEKLMFDVSPHSLDYLRALLQGPVTYADIAVEFGVAPKTVGKALRDLNDRYRELVRLEFQGRGPVPDARLLDPKGRTYTLTPAGKNVARALLLMHTRTVEAFESAVSRQAEVWLNVANDCWDEFETLARLVSGRNIILRPRSVRSTEVTLHLPDRRTPEVLAGAYALYSACLETIDVRAGQHLQNLPGSRDRNTSVIVTNVDHFQVLAQARTFGGAQTVPVDELFTDACELIVPEGGAVRDFLDLVDPTWMRWVRPVRATDLEGCLGVLRRGGLSSPAMVVHGLNPTKVPPGFVLRDITDSPQARAVRGLYQRRIAMNHLWSAVDREIWNEIWATADKHWVSELTHT